MYKKSSLISILEDKYEAFWTFCVVYPQNVTPSTPARFFLQETQRLFGR